MSGPSPGSGGHLTDVAGELALGALTGRQRGRAIEHLEQCDACRARVGDLTGSAEQLLRLLPEREPPPGFAIRVASRIARAKRSRTRKLLAVAAGTLIAAACGLAGWGLRTLPAPHEAPGSQGPAALTSATLITAGHQAIGTVFLHGGSRQWLFMTVDASTGNSTVICQLRDRNGHIITIGSFWLTSGDGYWGSPEPDQPAIITSARLITMGGTILATATFHGTS